MLNKRHHTTALLFLSALLLLSSCQKEESAQERRCEPAATEQCDLSVSITCRTAATKVISQADENENAIQNVQIWAFRLGNEADSGTLDICTSFGFDSAIGINDGVLFDPDNDELRVKCSTGPRRIYVVVNDVRDRTLDFNIANETDFLAQTTRLEDNGVNSLFMLGSTDKVLEQGEDEVSVTVTRRVASVVLRGITNDFSSTGFRNPGTFRVLDCYLLNVPAKDNFRGTLEPSALEPADWYARMVKETVSPRCNLIYDEGAPKVVDYGQTDDTIHTFYAYGNDCPLVIEELWSPRATLLVVEAEILIHDAWTKYYYPVALTGTPAVPGIRTNTRYEVNLTVHRPGSTDPNKPVTFFECTSKISITPWVDGEPYNPEI